VTQFQNRRPTESDIPMHGWSPYSAFHRERIRAHAKHVERDGSMEQKDWDHPIWLAVVTEEVGEVARVLCDSELGLSEDAKKALREELVQVGAMVAAWVDAIDAREHTPGGNVRRIIRRPSCGKFQ
jgi:NTP pyrophosphatase (non-canonical NTP hydrolase)